MKQQYDDTFLARWAAGELSATELAEFKASKAYAEYKMILDGVALLEAPIYNQQENFNATLAKITQQKAKKEVKVRRFIPQWAYIAAACLVLFFGAVFLFQETTYSTALAQQDTIEVLIMLPSLARKAIKEIQLYLLNRSAEVECIL